MSQPKHWCEASTAIFSVQYIWLSLTYIRTIYERHPCHSSTVHYLTILSTIAITFTHGSMSEWFYDWGFPGHLCHIAWCEWLPFIGYPCGNIVMRLHLCSWFAARQWTHVNTPLVLGKYPGSPPPRHRTMVTMFYNECMLKLALSLFIWHKQQSGVWIWNIGWIIIFKGHLTRTSYDEQVDPNAHAYY